MTDSIRNAITKWAIVSLLIIVFGYGLFRIYPYIRGPVITVEYPHEGEEVSPRTFQVKGTVKRAKEITLQGRPINIDTDGRFSETLVTHFPYTILVIEAVDAYGKKVQKVLHVKPSNNQ